MFILLQELIDEKLGAKMEIKAPAYGQLLTDIDGNEKDQSFGEQ